MLSCNIIVTYDMLHKLCHIVVLCIYFNRVMDCKPEIKIVHIDVFKIVSTKQEAMQIGYEPAGLTVHPPRMIEGGFIFFVWVSSATKIFSSK